MKKKKNIASCFRRSSSRCGTPGKASIELVPHSNNDNTGEMGVVSVGGTSKAKKKTGGARLWMKFDRTGLSETIEWDKSAIIKRVSIPARDLRILGPLFSHSSNILGIFRSIELISFNSSLFIIDHLLFVNL